ncbi:MAG TPA: DUF6077 domain-containing protein [Rhodanobacteraceae bacterium]|jgi:hypothetical protein|nr:DUF6077 domain-containing protein [Rhodanobacteraceae bacterium]
MRVALNGIVDRGVPLFVLPYAIWTMCVHLVTAAHASFDMLLHGLPVMALIAAGATVAWFRLAEPAKGHEPVAPGGQADGGRAAASIARTLGHRGAPFAVLAAAIVWVGSLSAGLPYAVFWWLALPAMFGAWMWTLRGESCATVRQAGTHATWVVVLVAAAAVCVTLFASRPDADDAFYRSISATLLRHPQQPVLLHDTLYRLPDVPILLQFYRLSNYDVLVAVLARLTGVDHLLVAYLLLPSIFAAFSVLAWAYLLRRIVPARWPWVLLILFLAMLALGEMHRDYGNFAFVRLFQGKAVLVTAMVPVVAGSALLFARHGGLRHWLLLFAAEVAALGVSASALFVAPAAAALGLAGGWSMNAAGSRRFVLGMLASAYVFGAGWAMASVTHGGQALVSSSPMPGVLPILDDTWGAWSARLLLVALLAAWAFVRDPVRARYLAAGAFFFLLAVLNPYTVRVVADHFVGVRTYWRLTWTLPLPLFLAVLLDGAVERAWRMRLKLPAACACAALAGLAIAFGWNFGTLRSANGVTLGLPGPKVATPEYQVAAKVDKAVPEKGVVLAPESVSIWLPGFVVHPELLGVRSLYLTRAFSTQDAARRDSLMRYVAGEYRPPDSAAWFAEALRRYRLTGVVLLHSAAWRGEMEDVLTRQGWQPVSHGAYDVWLKAGGVAATARVADESLQASKR